MMHLIMMRPLCFTLALVLLPTSAIALEYKDISKLYTDAPFPPPERAGISLLTEVGAVQGNPDGTFAPRKLVNRAEFIKIALASHPRIRAATSDADNCFPDVPRNAWFSTYVCLAKKRGIVGGYPDGTFKPENPVNYAEALKMLGELYGYTAYTDPDSEWWAVYVQAATNHRTILPVNISYDRWLNRGLVARLIAAYRAEEEGEIDLYRMAEQGRDVVAFLSERERLREETKEKEAQEVQEAEEAKETTEEQPEPVAWEPQELPSVSRFLLVGQRSLPIADGLLYPIKSPVKLRIAKVFLEKEARSLKKLFLVAEDGREIGELKLDITDQDDETWIATFAADADTPVFENRAGVRIAAEALIRDTNDYGFSEEAIEVKKFYIVVSEAADPTVSYQIVPSDVHTPSHRTSFGRITLIRSALKATGKLPSGPDQKIAEYTIGGEAIFDKAPRITNLHFHASASQGVTVSNFNIRSQDSLGNRFCSRNSGDLLERINCTAIPEEMGNLAKTRGQRTFSLSADIDIADDAIDPYLEVQLLKPGSLSERGDIIWTDGSVEFQWVELPEPLAEGVRWE